MSTVIVRVKTDHKEAALAADSVRGAMARAGYNIEDVYVWSDGPRHVDVHCHAIVSAIEPELEG